LVGLAASGSTTFNHDITGSNALFSGDVAVNGGDITTTAATFNLVTGSATTVNFAQSAATVSIAKAGSSTNVLGNLTSSNLAVNGGNITSTAGTLNIASTTNVTNLYGSNVLVGATGNVNLSGSAAIMNAGSSGLSLQKDGSTFSTITGDATTISLGATPGRTTANIFNSNVTTMNVGGASTTVNIGAGSGRTSVFNDLVLGTGNILVTNDAIPIVLVSSGNVITKLDVNNNGAGHKFEVQDWRGISQFLVGEDGNAELSGSLVISGTTTIGTTVERLQNSVGGTGTIGFDTTFSSVFYVNGPTGDILANFTNVPTTNNRVLTPTVILSQSATPRVISGVQINGTSGSILWANRTTPVGTANQQDVFGFSLIRSGSIWTVLGQMSTYG